MVADKKLNLAEMRKKFLDRSWEILMKYLERLDDDELLQGTDARSGAGVVKTLFDAVDKAEAGSPQEDDVELPEIPEALLDEFIRRIMGEEPLARSPRAKRRSEKPALAHPPRTECQA